MDGLLDWLWLIVTALALIQAWMLATQTWEHRRYARKNRSMPLRSGPEGRVLVIAPCRGMDVGLTDNLRRLFEQQHQNYSLRFVVEHGYDPAAAIIESLIREYPAVSAELLIAGSARDGGQKVHNLRFATRDLPEDVTVLAFVDSDARPGPQWLGRLIQRLTSSRAGAVTGYRWFIPQRETWANWLAYCLNSSAATMMRAKGYQLIWGGSWAIRRDVFEQLEVRQAWRGTLGDDLVVTEVLHTHGMRVAYEPACMIASPLNYSTADMASFVYRQYGLARLYAPQAWLAALVATTLATMGFWGTVVRLGGNAIEHGAFDWLAAAALAALYASHAVRGVFRFSLAQLYCPQQHHLWRRAARFDTWAGPLVGLAHWLGLLATLCVWRMRWRGIEYRIQAPDQVVPYAVEVDSWSAIFDRLGIEQSTGLAIIQPRPARMIAKTASH